MKKNIPQAFQHFTTLILFFLVLGYCFLGFSQNGYEGVFSQLMHGSFTAFKNYPIYGYLSNFITFRIYIALGSVAGNIVWPVIINIAFMLLAIIIFSLTFEKHITGLSIFQKTTAAFVIVFLFIADSFFILDMPAYAMLLSSLPLLSLQLLNENTKGYKLLCWVAVICFIWGMLTRVESTLPVLALILFWHLMQYKSVAATGRKFWPCIAALIIFLAGLKADFAFSTDYYKRLEPWAEPALTHPNGLIPLTAMKNAADSMRHIAASQLVYDDTVQLHETFLRSIIAQNKIPTGIGNTLYAFITTGYNRLLTEAENINSLLILLYTLLALLLLYTGFSSGQIIKTLLYLAAMAAGLIFIATISINSRYIILVINFGMLQLLIGLLQAGNAKKIINGAAIVLWCSSIAMGYENFYQRSELQKSQSQKQFYYQYLSEKYPNHTLVLDVNNIHLLPMPVFTPLKIFPFEKILFHDAAHEMHMSHLRNYFQKQCRCNAYSWLGVYNYFYLNKNKMVFISTPQRIQLKQNFLQKVYGQPYSFKKENIQGFGIAADTLFCYKLQ